MSHGRKSLIACLLFVSAPMVVADDPPATNVLILSDKSPGSVLHSMTWSCQAAVHEWELELCEDESQFADKINGGNWSRIFVFHKHIQPEPEFVGALRTWSDANPERPVMLMIWNVPNETTVDPTRAILPTTAIVTWQFASSTIAYANTKATEYSETKTFPNLILPDFVNIELDSEPVALGVITSLPQPCPGAAAATTSGAAFALAESSCRNDAIEKFFIDVEDCNKDQQEQLVVCDELYKPRAGDPNDPINNPPFEGDPEKWIACQSEVNTDHDNCLTKALHTYRRTIKLCEKEEEATSQPSQ